MSATGPVLDRPGPAAPQSSGLSVAGLLFANPLYRLTLAGRAPAALRCALPSSWPEDRAVAEAASTGTLLLAGRALPLSPLAAADAALGPRGRAALHGFSWLLDLRGLGTGGAQRAARAYVGDWIAANRGWSPIAWRSDVLGRRLAAWLIAADILIAGAEETFAPPFLASLATQARHLARLGAGAEPAAGGLAVAKGRLAAALALGIGSPRRAIGGVARAADHQILADGGPVQRSPAALLQALRDLLDIRGWLQAAGEPVPEAVTAAIARGVPMLRGLRLGDGGLTVAHGGKAADPRLIDAVLARSGVTGRAREDAPDAGFQRVASGGTVVVVDTGPPPHPAANPDGHAGMLAFEVSVGTERLIVNAGSIVGDDAALRHALRETAAHSTLIVDAMSTTPVRRDGRLEAGDVTVTVERRERDGAVWLDTAHDAYVRRFHLRHRRRLYLSATGEDLRGEDTLDGPGKAPFAVLFHLHPDVQASALEDGRAVLLRAPSGAGWRLIAAGGTVDLEDGLYLGAADVPRRTVRIVIRGRTEGNGGQVRWVLRREGAA